MYPSVLLTVLNTLSGTAPLDLIFEDLCILSKNKVTLDKVSNGSDQSIKVQDCIYCIVLEKNAWYIAIKW